LPSRFWTRGGPPRRRACRRTSAPRFRGLKLYPPIQRFHAFDEQAYPTYERAEALGIPIVFHFGVTLDYRSDLRFADPLDLHPVARDFPISR